MSSATRFIKFALIYTLLFLVVLDVYFFVIKPQLLKSVNQFSVDSQQIHALSAASIPGFTETDHLKAKSRVIHDKSCQRHPGAGELHCDSDSNVRILRRQSYARYAQQRIKHAFASIWDGFFIALEEVEQLSVAFFDIALNWISEAKIYLRSSMFSDSDVLIKPGFEDQRSPESQSQLSVTSPSHVYSSVLDTDVQQGTFALSAKIQRNILSKNVMIHRPANEENFINITQFSLTKKANLSIDLVREANSTLRLAREFLRTGNLAKAKRLLEHARQLNPYDAEAMAAYGEVFEHHRPPDYVKAEHYYGKALLTDPTNEKAKASRKRTLPLVEQIDQARFNRIDQKVYQYYHIPETHPGLRRLKKEHYFRYVYHSNAIEGNTLDLAQTRAILETRIAVGGKSLLEHNEVLGLDAALMFLNSSLLRKPGPLLLSDLLEIHRRVLGYVDLQEAGRLRNTQVFIADFEPPPANLVPSLMADFLNWLNSEDTAELHPVEVAALAHWKLVYIHPFYDGNGRTARLLMNLILMRSGYPPAIVRVEERAIYYQLIKEANEGDVRPFIRFIGHCTEATIDEFLLTAQRVSDFEAAESGASLSLAKQSEDCKPRVINL
ncbi:hypothetical protein BOX15_Mlig033133g1 [Macrostomum lignano]|uniref:protein adenylyltransferase n=2 Tax=Macrostomum lignano TaxID=282301 RepID=A0A267GBR0_9PLAT|nr:hypothetical protein BOX15_Mlig033133g1 [Macrostomum lignano]